jgi:hypothetical protein
MVLEQIIYIRKLKDKSLKECFVSIIVRLSYIINTPTV